MRLPALTCQHDIYMGGVIVATINPPEGVYPRVEIHHEKGIGGWHSSADHDDAEVDNPPGTPGERPYTRTSRGKTLIYNLQAAQGPGSSYVDLVEHLNGVSAALHDHSSFAVIAVTPWDGIGEGAVPVPIWACIGRVLDYDADELQLYAGTRQPTPWIRDPLLTFRMLNGLWLWWNESGALGVPMHWEDVNAVEVTNSGLAPNNPVITVTGVAAGDDVHVGRDLPGGGTLDLWFRDPGAGDLVIDFTRHQAFIGLDNVSGTRDVGASDWWDAFVPGIPPGTHNVFRGPGAGTGIKVDLFSADR